MKVNVRHMTRQDKAAVMQILHQTPEFTADEVTVAEELIDSYLESTDGSGYHIMVAELGQSVAGYICYGPTPMTQGTWDIYWMAVAPLEQGKGIGKALLAFAEDVVRTARGRLSLIETSSKPEYEKTRRFHASQGYELVAKIADFYAPGDDKLIYQKCLR